MHLLRNSIKEYAWGSFSALPAFLGRPSPAATPQAELWVGAHPLGSSELWVEDRWVSLEVFIAQRPEEALGVGWRSLPFLLKILAVETPLSLQAHPNLQQAREGYAAQQALGLPPEACNYKDANHKPELLCALSPFEALMGFEKPERLLRLFEALGIADLKEVLRFLRLEDESVALRAFFESLLCWPQARRRALLECARGGLLRVCEGEFASKAALALRLLEAYPEDMGVLGSLCLNLLSLGPLEAVFVPPGCLHAYLHGMGVEIMASSDNVLRGGLTPKRVDVEALLSVLCFESAKPRVQQVVVQPGEACVLEAPVREFGLSLVRVSARAPFVPSRLGVELLLVLEGEVVAQGPWGQLRLKRGQSAFVCASEGPYMLMGEALLARATGGAP